MLAALAGARGNGRTGQPAPTPVLRAARLAGCRERGGELAAALADARVRVRRLAAGRSAVVPLPQLLFTAARQDGHRPPGAAAPADGARLLLEMLEQPETLAAGDVVVELREWRAASPSLGPPVELGVRQGGGLAHPRQDAWKLAT